MGTRVRLGSKVGSYIERLLGHGYTLSIRKFDDRYVVYSGNQQFVGSTLDLAFEMAFMTLTKGTDYGKLK